MPQIVLTPQESEQYFHNALCNSLSYIESGYGLELEYSKEKYQSAKENWKANNPDSFPCIEDVLSQILKDGGELTLTDIEGDGEMTRTITLKDVHERVPKTPLSHLVAMIEEQDDATTGDILLQTVFYDEVIYG